MAITKLKEIRKSRNLTQKDLSDLSGVSLNLIARLESGELKNTTLKTMTKLAKALNCTIEELFFEVSV